MKTEFDLINNEATKKREAIEFAEWIENGKYFREGTNLSISKLYQLFKQKP